MQRIYPFLLLGLVLMTGCKRSENESFAYGNFEATETIVSAQANGQLIQFHVEEGQSLKSGDIIGYIDTAQLYLKKQQLMANRKAIASKTSNIVAQADVLRTQLQSLRTEQQRFTKLVADKAATQKQLDDINAQIKVTQAQIQSLETQNTPVFSEIKGIDAQLAQLSDQVDKSIIRNPVNGTVLVKFAEPDEVVAFGKPLYSIAPLDTINLRAYVSGDQLPQIRIGQQVKVLTDNGKGGLDTSAGKVSWIASQAEFTPKTVQTRDERVTLVYAIKVQVPNDGRLKIGMPGEIRLMNNESKK